MFQLNNLNKNTLLFDLSNAPVVGIGPGGSAIYQVILRESEVFSFESGDVFGIRQSDSSRSKVALLHQTGGGLSYQIELESSNYHNQLFTTRSLSETDIYPLISIETGK